MGLILDSSLLIADEREGFDLPAWLHGRPPEPVAVGVITFSELWFGIEVEKDAARSRRRRRWAEKLFRRLEVVPVDVRVARIHARIWAQLTASGLMAGPHDLFVAATALQRRCGGCHLQCTRIPARPRVGGRGTLLTAAGSSGPRGTERERILLSPLTPGPDIRALRALPLTRPQSGRL